jgi:phospholipid/cholesterol/gamma-HCH transport system substrate-binding protein
MTIESNPFKAGLFMIASFILALAVFFAITGQSFVGGKLVRYTVSFPLAENVSGLQAGADVRLGGLRVGSIDTIDIDTTDGIGAIVVVFDLPAEHLLRTDAVVQVEAVLTGTSVLNVTSLGRGEPVAQGGIIQGRGAPLNRAIAGLADTSQELTGAIRDVRENTVPRVNRAMESADELFGQAGQAVERVRITFEQADQLVREVRGNVAPAVDRYNQVADNAAGAMQELREVLGDTKSDVRQSAANVREATSTLRDRLPEIADKLATSMDDLRATLARTGALIDEATATMTSAKQAVGSVQSVVSGNRARIDEIVRSVNVTTSNLAAASAEIRAAPWRLLYRPKPGEVANQNLYDAARQFAEGARHLHDSAMALRDAAADPNADAEAIRRKLEALDATFTKFDRVEKELWERVR